ncbi:class I SAM-dependent methyltransferase [Microbacterium mangrovi]|uniref:class I SAM-dependent methyltransferase n=1 Tax=Microbacterium mangrovi TaxID=1348253 RepID=UPI00068D66C8|nr:class I SAM-dependent methyltransferase [Microbacterium mangrovi]
MDKAPYARSFLDAGEEYERYRPGFPAGAVALIAPSPVAGILDLGAGTGKLTRELTGLADTVYAVDPSEPMLAQLRRISPTVDARLGTAEQIPLPDASVDLVTVAQAFHWFDRDAACAEIHRVLRPGGILALVWNTTDADCAWDVACGRIAHPHLEGDEPSQDADPAHDDLPGFAPVDSGWVRWSEDLARADYLHRWATVSSMMIASESERAERLARMDAVLDADPTTRGRTSLQLPTATEVLVYRRA